MAKQTVPAEMRKAIALAQRLIEDVARTDGNEASTRSRVENIFRDLLGYGFEHLSHEYAIAGAGLTEHVDFAIQLSQGDDAKPIVMVELKRVGVDLRAKHLKQVSSYAINAGCEWVLLTNGREWRMYHVSFGQPPVTKLVDQWNLLKDETYLLAKKFELISLRDVRRGSLEKLWEKTQVLAPESILTALLSADSLRQARRVLRKKTDVLVDFDDLVNGFRRLLNEAAARTLDGMQLDLPVRRKSPRKSASELPPGDPEERNGPPFKCDTCGQEFPTRKGLSGHIGRRHKDRDVGGDN